jgi:signal transduction histidine kinase
VIIPVVLLLTLLFNYLLFLRTSARLYKVTAAVLSVRAGDYRVSLPDSNNDALGQLEKGIISMAAQVENAFQVEKNAKTSQDEFTANIAHDLRTPMTSIIGYLAFREFHKMYSEHPTAFRRHTYTMDMSKITPDQGASQEDRCTSTMRPTNPR